jgi:hypothetical protein
MKTANEPTHFKLVTKADAAQVFSVCTKTIENYIKAGLLPSPVQFGAKEYWHPEVFKAHLSKVFRSDHVEEFEADSQTPELERAVLAPQTKRTGIRDSSASVRQQTRQAAKLKRLNS